MSLNVAQCRSIKQIKAYLYVKFDALNKKTVTFGF